MQMPMPQPEHVRWGRHSWWILMGLSWWWAESEISWPKILRWSDSNRRTEPTHQWCIGSLVNRPPCCIDQIQSQWDLLCVCRDHSFPHSGRVWSERWQRPWFGLDQPNSAHRQIIDHGGDDKVVINSESPINQGFCYQTSQNKKDGGDHHGMVMTKLGPWSKGVISRQRVGKLRWSSGHAWVFERRTHFLPLRSDNSSCMKENRAARLPSRWGRGRRRTIIWYHIM